MAKSIDVNEARQVLMSLSEGWGGQTLPLSDLINLPKASEQRKLDTKKVQQLMHSIVNVGKLVEPMIVFVEDANVSDVLGNGDVTLVAGAHRRHALKLLADACQLNFDYVRVPIVTQSYGVTGAELLATNTSRRFTAWERAHIKAAASEATDEELKTLSRSKILKGKLEDAMTTTTLLKVSRWCEKADILDAGQVSHFANSLYCVLYDMRLSEEQANARANLPTNVSRFWLKYVELAYDVYCSDKA